MNFFRAIAYTAIFTIGFFVATAAPVFADTAALNKCFYWNECLSKDTPKNESCDLQCDTPGKVCHCFEPRQECGANGGYCYQKWPGIKLSVPINGKDTVLDLADYIAKLYNYGAGLAAVVAGVIIIFAGLQWMTAISGAQIEAAKKRIQSAVIGLVLALGAVTLLATVNPDIIAMRLPKVPLIKKEGFNPSCTITELCAPCGATYMVARPKNASKDWQQPTDCKNVVFRLQDGDPPPGCDGCKKWSNELAAQSDLIGPCVGRGCSVAKCGDDATMKCRPPAAGEKTEGACPTKPAGATAVTYMCGSCNGAGSSCSPNGQNANCCSGSCEAGKCSGGKEGDPCNTKGDCLGGLECKLAQSTAGKVADVISGAAKTSLYAPVDGLYLTVELVYNQVLAPVVVVENLVSALPAPVKAVVQSKAQAVTSVIRSAADQFRSRVASFKDAVHKAIDDAFKAGEEAAKSAAPTSVSSALSHKKQCVK